MVSKASDDLPDPDRPVKTISFSRGSSRVTFLRLCSRAPRITSVSDTARRIAAGSAAPDVGGHPEVDAREQPDERATGGREAGDRGRPVALRVERDESEPVESGLGHPVGRALLVRLRE